MKARRLIALGWVAVAPYTLATESPGPVPLRELVPSVVLEQPGLSIADPAANDGMMNSYSVSAPVGEFTAASTHGLCKLVREINAIEEMAELEGTTAFSDSAVEAAKDLGRGAKNLVTDPSATLGGAARGLGKAFRRLGDRVVQGNERSATEDSGFEQAIGFSKAKRENAYEFGVDVYSGNPSLQTYLDQLTWARFSGGMAVSLVSTVASGGLAGAALTVSNYAQALEEMIRDLSPADLRSQTRSRLLDQGINPDLVNLLIRNEHLSPSHQAYVAGALATLEGVEGKEHLVRRAADADNSDTGFDRQVQVQLYAHLHNRHPISRFLLVDGHVVAQGRDGSVHVAAAVDYLIWTRQLAELFDQAEPSLVQSGLAGPRQLWLSGTASPVAVAHLVERGWTLQTNLVETLGYCNPRVPDLSLDAS